MNKKRYFFRFIFFSLISISIFLAVSGCFIYVNYVRKKLPEHIYIKQFDSAVFDMNIPVTGNVYKTAKTDDSSEGQSESYVFASSGDVISRVDFNDKVTFLAGTDGHYRMELRLFGLFYLDSVDIDIVDQKKIYPCGFQSGLYIKCDGILVVKTQEVSGISGNNIVPCEGAISAGDYIIQVNGENVEGKQHLSRLIKSCGGDSITFTIMRNNEYLYAVVNPVLCDDNTYKLGLWVKDDAQGVGTITYIDANGNFGALGHGISDSETSSLLCLKEGRLYKTKIISVKKGKKGEPGEFIGVIDYNKNNIIGQITENTDIGIYGKIDSGIIDEYGLKPMEIGYSYSCKKGAAYIRLTDDETFKDYEIEITDLKNGDNKNITFKVTDKNLLEITNGIVQGMSGCPIIQDGKIIGAVTHVLVNDSTKGYGIYIENMLKH